MPILPHFQPVTPLAGDVIRGYADLVPPEVVELWEQQGTGTFANGLPQIVDPGVFGVEIDGRPLFEAVDANGPLARDESFGYVPLLGLGGPEQIENLQKVKTVEHLAIITQLMGPLVY